MEFSRVAELIPTLPLLQKRLVAAETTQVILKDPILYRSSSEFTTLFGNVVEELGAGTYGTVYKTDKNIAIKELSSDDECDNGIDSTSIVEISILKYLKHPNIIPIYGIDLNIKDCTLQFAMPLAEGSLQDDIERRFTQKDRKMIIYQILRGLAYCHSKFVWHLDIKPANILKFTNGLYKLADFGVSGIYAVNGKPHSTCVITLRYRPPEILLGDLCYNETVDVWAVGVILAQMILGEDVFHGNSEMDMLYSIFKLLGTPNNRHWPGIQRLPQYRSNVPR